MGRSPATARKRGQERGLWGDLLRLLLAGGLLGAVVVVTVLGINSTVSKVSRGRTDDHLERAQLLANSLGASLEGPRGAALAAAAGTASSQLPGWDMLRVDRAGAFVGLSGRYQALSGVVQGRLPQCDAGAGLRDLVAAVKSAPVVAVLDAPGTCDQVLAGAAPSPAGVVVVSTDLSAYFGQAKVAANLRDDVRRFIVDPLGTSVSPRMIDGQVRFLVEPARPYLTDQVASASKRVARHQAGSPPREVVDAAAPVDDGWAVAVEQDASNFDVGDVIRPTPTTVLMAVVLFAVLLGLQGLSDARRRAAARAADAHRAAFLAVLGHELRTPLTVIRGFVDTLSSRWANLTDDQRHDLLDRLPQQSRRLNRVVDRLLLAANMQAGAAPALALGPVEVAPALERVAASYTALAPLHEFVVDAPPAAVVSAEKNALDQILDQLVDNAVKYSPSGGVVRLSATHHRGRIEIAVEDEGVGLPANTRAIFDAFTQGESMDGRVHDEGGVGVGLYIVRTLCEQLGASARAERRLESGARFVVTLRARRERAAVRV